MRLHTKILILFLAAAPFVAAFILLNINHSIRQIDIDDVRRFGTVEAGDLGDDIAENIAAYRHVSLLQQVLTFQQITHALYIAVLDSKGRVLCHTRASEIGRIYQDANTRLDFQLKEPGFRMLQDSNIMEISAPIWSHAGKISTEEYLFSGEVSGKRLIGMVRMGLPMDHLLNKEHKLIRQITLIGLVTGTMAFMLIFFCLKKMLRPIQTLADATARIAQGAYGITLPVLTHDDLGDLTHNFNTMSQTLSETTMSKERFRSLIENISDVITVLDSRGDFVFVSPSMVRIMGYDPEELVAKSAFNYIHPEDREQAQQLLQKVLLTSGLLTSSEFRFKTKEGSWRILESKCSCLSGARAGSSIIISSRDITERRGLTEKLKLLQMAADSVSDGIVVCDALAPDMPLRYVNPAFEKMTGYTEAEALGKNPRFLQRGKRDQPGLDKIKLALANGEGCNAVVENFRKDGTPFWNEIRIRPVHNANGQVTHYVGIKHDATERIQASQQLKESEERFRQLAQNIPEVFWLCSLDLSQMIYINPSYEEIWGRSCESLYQNPRSFIDAIHPEDRDSVITSTQHLSEGLDQEFRVVQPDGQIRWIHAQGITVRDASGKAYRLAGIAEDVTKSHLIIEDLRLAKTKLEDMQAQLVQSEKLAGIGQLAAGVAHELNNPLSGVMGFSQLLLDDTSLKPQQRKDVETILAQSQRCRTIIQNLLQFCRRKEPKQESLDLLLLLKATLEMVSYEITTSGIELIQKLPASLPHVRGDSNQLQQVLINLITNAQQAMKTGQKRSLTVEAEHAGNQVRVRISDTGTGIAPDIMSKIFDPFFTTKPVGQGTGLGLSICYGIVHEHGGKISAESRPGQGAAFTLELPVCE